MTIGDPYITGSISPTVVANNNNNNNNNSSANNHNTNNMTHHNRNMNINSSPLPAMYYTNRQKLMENGSNSANSSSLHSNHRNVRCKRRNSESENEFKKVKQFNGNFNNNSNTNNNIPQDQLNLDNIDLNEYPKFNHPDGGIIQFTPIGNIRTFLSDNNIVHRTVEKNSTFDLNQRDCGIDGYKLYLGSISMDTSPSNEIESYMINGYSNVNYNNSSSSSNINTSYYNNPTSSCAANFDYDCDSDLDDDYDEYMS